MQSNPCGITFGLKTEIMKRSNVPRFMREQEEETTFNPVEEIKNELKEIKEKMEQAVQSCNFYNASLQFTKLQHKRYNGERGLKFLKKQILKTLLNEKLFKSVVSFSLPRTDERAVDRLEKVFEEAVKLDWFTLNGLEEQQKEFSQMIKKYN